MINAENEQEAVKAINSKRNKWMADHVSIPPKPKQIIAAFKETHPVIQDKFCSGQGIFLQYMDSQIAEKIMLTLAKQDICCLCIHDSFIVQEQHEQLLFTLMKEYFIESFGQTPRISRKTKNNKPFYSKSDFEYNLHQHILFDMAL